MSTMSRSIKDNNMLWHFTVSFRPAESKLIVIFVLLLIIKEIGIMLQKWTILWTTFCPITQ